MKREYSGAAGAVCEDLDEMITTNKLILRGTLGRAVHSAYPFEFASPMETNGVDYHARGQGVAYNGD